MRQIFFNSMQIQLMPALVASLFLRLYAMSSFSTKSTIVKKPTVKSITSLFLWFEVFLALVWTYIFCRRLTRSALLEARFDREERNRVVLNKEDIELIRRTARFFHLIARSRIVKISCLHRSLAAKRVLVAHGIKSQLYIAIPCDNNGSREPHAWLGIGASLVIGRKPATYHEFLSRDSVGEAE